MLPGTLERTGFGSPGSRRQGCWGGCDGSAASGLWRAAHRIAPRMVGYWSGINFAFLLGASMIPDLSYRLPDRLEAEKAGPHFSPAPGYGRGSGGPPRGGGGGGGAGGGGGGGGGGWGTVEEQSLSPRVRGNPALADRRPRRARSIPACAGEPPGAGRSRAGAGVYPRVCGGTVEVEVGAKDAKGLSPRVRGNPALRRHIPGGPGSIPACAGEPSMARAGAHPSRVYPRVCGGTSRGRHSASSRRGLSPRVRGNLRVSELARRRRGSIPACAGEPRCGIVLRSSVGVYPRVCGGTHETPVKDALMQGLSPRVRGNLRCTDWRRLQGGLSPRVRGNHPRDPHAEPEEGSIPACAGEPTRKKSTTLVFRVYPRVCGGTPCAREQHLAQQGLSPRVRGNRVPARGGRGA